MRVCCEERRAADGRTVHSVTTWHNAGRRTRAADGSRNEPGALRDGPVRPPGVPGPRVQERSLAVWNSTAALHGVCLSQADGMLGKGAVLSGPPSTTPSSLPSQIPRQASLLPPLPLPPLPPSVLSRLPRRQSVHVVMTSHPGRCCLSQAASWLFQLYFLSDHARVFELASFSRSCYRSAFIRLGVLWADRTFASDGCSQPALVSSPLLQWVYLPPMAHMQSCCAPCSYAAMLARNQWVWCYG